MAWLGEVQWLSLLPLFVSALAVVVVYLVQYGLSALGRGGEKPLPAPQSELLQGDEESLFAWLLSLNSWRREWRKAWIAALNWEAKRREAVSKISLPLLSPPPQDSHLFTFEEDAAPQPLELVVQQVVSVIKSAEEKCLLKREQPSLSKFPHVHRGSINPVCTVQLNDPLQKFYSSVASNSTDLLWKEEFIFELNARSKDLQVKVFENGEMDSGFSALATVPLDLFRKQPSGQRSFALNSKFNSNSTSVGFVSAEFSYIEPSESRNLKVPAMLPVAKVEKDRTVMPCGTVVTTVTSVKAKPALHSDSPMRSPAKIKVIEKDLSIQAIHCRKASVSKALSSSDTELLVLNGTDPVAEVAIRQLSESAKQKLKSPRKKSTLIISGVSKTNLSQDCEAALMMDYAAAMDGSYLQNDAIALEEQSPPDEELSLSVSQTLPSHEGIQENSHDAWTLDDSSQQWHRNALLDHDCDKVSESSISISESEAVKKSKGGILKKGARLFFLRRHHLKDPGMSQSHNDLIYLQQPTSDGTRRKGGTLTRILNKRIISKSKSKNKVNGTSVEPYA
ncbi:C2 domain-containing protein 2 [Sphaerodactylus townsendi]|uniref:C2 domain-containing protein 2 n=1 Tax=Sphaerodactylus townsendi TaxID=933632 RepID=UPI0020264168|nr:C2 domain-containing protein 2 [Sphaerodactylus townsendi]